MTKFSRHDIEWRLADCVRCNYNPSELSKLWGIQNTSCTSFMRKHCRAEYFKAMSARTRSAVERAKPEYENQRMFDLQVLTRQEWCRKWSIPLWEYGNYLRMYEREHGTMATPEIREQWERQYWEKM